MPTNNKFLNELSVLSAYDEYTEEVQVQQVKKEFQPVNHLGSELSPYLLAHAKNPVGWYSWCQEAFDVARTEDRPIFLSIGYFSKSKPIRSLIILFKIVSLSVKPKYINQ